MSFTVDKQTLEDLNLLGKFTPGSIFGMFNKVQTSGGERLLLQLFKNPLTDPDAINKRSGLLSYFQEKALDFPFSRAEFQTVEHYFSTGSSTNYPAAFMVVFFKKIQASLLRDERYPALQKGLVATIGFLNSLNDFLKQFNDSNPTPFDEERQLLRRILETPALRNLLKEKGTDEFPTAKLAAYDHLLKHTLQADIEILMECIYKLDVYIAVGKVGKAQGFSYAKALPKGKQLIEIAALWHPALIKGVANPVGFSGENNMIFLTGANMAGKSTFMKSLGIALYLAHMGFPLAARGMHFSICDGIYSSINVSDSLNMGYSHFYAEVLRVKKAAEEVASGKSFLVLFDELFKGTNVKDAYDATLAVTDAFAQYRQCFFVISTHIIEVGEALQKTTDNVQFAYLPTVMDGKVPRYTYLLEQGITTDRQGMLIIENEGILNLLKN
ncbi:DNA mismatch repair protein [Sphingobacterium alkalisoli]|uniref:DNA mismatch repair protein n=1 Tax=Sphingobacterium alkalisoli TaxID=1874115 RepID=A0A4U0H9S9_9SPHI|nr:DNA mismatch repair protein [Sphingobacterium alkalisoli]TJY68657.1 DNA mismatch repair protein [Sphingobacterium alkalisoli]GGH05009.1 DNA mismatch repair protein MutS [Sphingobacterium alkalisoli]